VVRDGKVRRTPVTLGDDDGTSVEVLSGLGPDDSVVVRPSAALEEDSPVVVSLVKPADAARK
jgi:multidrug efflux pump subunit AcrA (membrane-fusion protein)